MNTVCNNIVPRGCDSGKKWIQKQQYRQQLKNHKASRSHRRSRAHFENQNKNRASSNHEAARFPTNSAISSLFHSLCCSFFHNTLASQILTFDRFGKTPAIIGCPLGDIYTQPNFGLLKQRQRTEGVVFFSPLFA